MKKVLVLFIFLLLPVFVYADSCSVKEDTQTNLDRTITCDSKLKTTTKYSSSKEETVLSNGVCTIKCTENVVFSIDPIKKVLSGTSFNYPLYVSGERKCTSVYDYVTYETTIAKLVEQYASSSGAAKTSKGNELTNYYSKKKECDEFAVDGSTYEKKYTMKADKVELKVATSTKVDTLHYEYKGISNYNSALNKDEIKYYACNYNADKKTCDGSDRTMNGWTETARIFGKYTMPNRYVERYTGEVKPVSSSTTCNAGDRYFVSLDELTKPIVGATGDNGYKLTLTAPNIGNNLISGGEKWSLTVNCWYQVKNLFSPQSEDDNFDEYGKTAFSYRQIDLNDPFPEREPGANWYNKTGLITSTAKDIDKLKRFSIVIDGAPDIKKIKEYNENNKDYVTFNLYLNKEDNGTVTDRSHFIDTFYYIVNRVVDGK